jgi:hypothetical protein
LSDGDRFGNTGSDPSRDGIPFEARQFSQRRGSDPVISESVSVTQFGMPLHLWFRLNQFANTILRYRREDLSAVRFAAQE